jgi:hypothetical protein
MISIARRASSPPSHRILSVLGRNRDPKLIDVCPAVVDSPLAPG